MCVCVCARACVCMCVCVCVCVCACLCGRFFPPKIKGYINIKNLTHCTQLCFSFCTVFVSQWAASGEKQDEEKYDSSGELSRQGKEKYDSLGEL